MHSFYRRLSQRLAVSLLIVGWIFSGWPQLWNFPPEILMVRASTERQAPDALLTQTGLTGAVTAVQDDPDSPDGSWLTASQNTATVARVSFPTPAGPPNTGAGLQEFRIRIRKTALNLGKTDDTYTVHLYEGGILKQSTIASGSNTPAGGVVVSALWDASNLSNADGSGVEAYITTTPEGSGKASDRGSIEIGAVEWNVDYAINTAPTLSISQPDGTGDSVTSGSAYNITYTLADSENVVTAAFYYDTDASGLNGTAITGACATAVEGTNVTCSWDTTGVADGSYYVYGITDDGVASPVSAYSSGQVTITTPVVAVSLTTDGSVNFGFLPKNTTQDSTASGVNDVEIIQIDSGPADVEIKSGVFSDGGNSWSLDSTSGADTVVWEFSKDGSIWTLFGVADTLYAFENNVAQSATRNIYLKITTPTDTTSYQQHSAPVTIVVSVP